ncbi:MAG: hypothetical protein MMC33_003772 [Icmadophila ericetorum]|nr:hypothetical protein [Icmadophila ericetorum]
MSPPTTNAHSNFYRGEHNHTLIITHPLPASLLTAFHASVSYAPLVFSTISPILSSHQPETLAAVCRTCNICSSPTVDTVTSYQIFHRPEIWKGEEPTIIVYVLPVCEKEECKKEIRENLEYALCGEVKIKGSRGGDDEVWGLWDGELLWMGVSQTGLEDA